MVLFEQHARIGYITLNRPEKRNALSDELVEALKEAFAQAAAAPDVKVIVLRGAGSTFCAGADLAYLQKLRQNGYEENLADSLALKDLFEAIYTHPKMVIAQIEGHAIAGGCGLATICDFSFAVPDAKFGYTEVKIGFIPALVSVFLLRKIGEGRAKELLLSGDLITATQAQAYGLVNRVVAPEHIAEEVATFAHALCANNSAEAMQRTKQMIAHLPALSLADALHYAAEQNAHARNTPDCHKGIDAFVAKEKLQW